MLRFLPLLGVAYSTNQVTNVVCNGKDEIKFDIDGPGLGTWYRFDDCNDSGKNGDAPDGVVTKTESGGVWTLSFNPYTHCEGDANPNDATSYSVGMKFIMSGSENLGGVTVYTGAIEVHLTCTFQASYDVTAELGALEIQAGQVGVPIDGPTFTVGFNIHRWDSDPYTAASEAVIAYNPVKFWVSGNAAFQLTDMTLRISKVVLRKRDNHAVSLDIFDHSTGCGLTQLGFGQVPGRDIEDKAAHFQYKAIFLDNDIDAVYEVVVSVHACPPGANNNECKKFNLCQV